MAQSSDLCQDLESLYAELRGMDDSAQTRMMAALARNFPLQAKRRGILEPKLGVFTDEFFLRLVAAEIASGGEAGLAVFHCDRFEDIRQKQGAEVAGQVLTRLADALLSRQAAAEWLGRLAAGDLALLLPQAELRVVQERAKFLNDDLRRSSRFPISVGVSHTSGLSGGAEPGRELLDLAQRAAEAARRSGGRQAHILASRGSAAPIAAADDIPAKQPESSLAARYQRLVLLNRMSLEIFAAKPFSDSLAEACNTVLALTQAEQAAIYFCDDLGQPFLAIRHGHEPAERESARREEAEVLKRALAERRIVSGAGTRYGWLAAPLLRFLDGAPADLGALVVGFPEPRPQDPDIEQTLLEASRLLRNARLLQKQSEHRQVLAAVTEQSADAIYVTDQDSCIISWNTAAEELFGYPRAEAIGQPASFLAPKDRLAELEERNAQALREGCVKNFETVRQRKDGELVPMEATFFLLRDEKGRNFGMVRVFRDITKRKEIERMKSEFVSLVSHELRTPLTSIRGFAETIFDFWDEIKPEQRRQYLGIILSESKRLGNLVTNFLDISRLEAGRVELRPSAVDLSDLARRAASLFKDHPGKISINVDFATGSEKAWADEDQLYRVFVNLIGNAIKYSPAAGAISVIGRLAGTDVEVAVSDQGPGIPPQAQDKLFQKFYRVGDAVSRKTPGTGLGLAICKNIIESHSGRIWVESAPGRGATFRFAFPKERLKTP